MPIQELIQGVTFPNPVLNVNTIPNPLTYLGSLLQFWVKGDAGVTSTSGPSVAVSASAISGDVGTLTLATATAYAVGQPITFAGLTNATALNGTFHVASQPSTTTVTVAVSAANVTSAAEASATATGSVASEWADQSGNSRNLLQAGTVPMPAIITTAQNGLPGLKNPSTTTNGACGLRTAFSSALDLSATNPFSIMYAYIPFADNEGYYDLVLGNLTGGPIGWQAGHANALATDSNVLKPALRLAASSTAQCLVTAASAIPAGQAVNITLVNSGSGTAAGVSIYVNGTQITTTTISDTLAGATTQTGNSGLSAPSSVTGGNWVGDSTLLEGMVISQALTQQQINVLNAYLTNKWAS
jgi:hypothetical protein